jgi:hypothetical protein
MRKSALGLSLTFFLLFMATSMVYGATTIYVDSSASGAGDGSSWADAYPKMQDALAVATSGDQIWVAEGVYYPDEGGGQTDNDRGATFTMINGVEAYGGFNGTESSLDERNFDVYITVLSGDIDQNDTTNSNGVVTDVANISGDNAYHVLTGGGTDNSAVLDGFTITAGQANDSRSHNSGGGMNNNDSSPMLKNMIFTGNYAGYGGGMLNNNSSNPSLTNVTFTRNRSGASGGGMNNSNSSPTLMNVKFSGNLAYKGGGMYNSGGIPYLTNVIISGNRANASGGGIYNTGSNPRLTNVTISGNLANEYFGGGIYNYNSYPLLDNVILWNNHSVGLYGDFEIANAGTSIPIIEYSDIRGCGGSGSGWSSACGIDGGNNIDAYPYFVISIGSGLSTAGDFHLQFFSPAIDAGRNSVCPATDFDGNPRPQGEACDMGAYEAAPPQYRLFLPLVIH